MDIIELLKKEHEEVSALFQQFFGGGTITRLVNKVTGNRPPRRKSIATKICDALAMHTRLEEETFYPEVRATGDGELNKMVDEADREHTGIKDKIAKARTLLGDDQALDHAMTDMQGDVDHHVREEEHEMFPRLHDLMSEHKLEEIGRRYAAAKRTVKGAEATSRSGARRPISRTKASRARKVSPARGRKVAAAPKRKTSVRTKAAAGRRKKRASSTAKRARGGR